MPSWAPGLAKQWIASELRRLRLAAGISQKAAAEQLADSPARVSALESGEIVAKERDFQLLLPLYGAPERVEEFIALRPIAKKRNWWIRIPTVPEWLTQYLALEEGAERIDIWNGFFIPDLLQTREYATTQLNETMPASSAKDVADQVDLRLRRQEIWRKRGKDRALLRIILSETALQVRGDFHGMMWDQYEQLLKLASDKVELHVLPITAGPPPSPSSPFSIANLDIPTHPGVLYTESLTGGHYSEDSFELENAKLIFNALLAKSLNRTESRNFIRDLKSDLKQRLN